MADAAVLDLDGEPLTNERLSALLGDGRVSFQVIPGTERRWPQSHSACLLLELSACGAADRRTAFLKVMSAKQVGDLVPHPARLAAARHGRKLSF